MGTLHRQAKCCDDCQSITEKQPCVYIIFRYFLHFFFICLLQFRPIPVHVQEINIFHFYNSCHFSQNQPLWHIWTMYMLQTQNTLPLEIQGCADCHEKKKWWQFVSMNTRPLHRDEPRTHLLATLLTCCNIIRIYKIYNGMSGQNNL